MTLVNVKSTVLKIVGDNLWNLFFLVKRLLHDMQLFGHRAYPRDLAA